MISYYLKQTIKTNKETIKKLSSLDKVLEKVTSSNIWNLKFLENLNVKLENR